ncbi:hypothetical protein HID58_060628 [Brassica napus]|uniref:Uncharacterized protein n=1 Tax=Brassica napus TaxID=3708 RepID=A0ABQ7ZWC3_BRANA|nr:hypothetical protein HID58_060628 [Brassica napus]
MKVMKGSFLKLIDFYGLMVVVKEEELEELMAEVELLEVDIKVVVMKEVVSGDGGSGGGYGGRRGGSGSYGSGYGSCGVVSGHGSVEGLVVVVGCVLLWFYAHIFSALL